MARIRTTKPEFYTDEKMNQLSRDVRSLYRGLWNFSDDMGRMQYSPRRIKSQIFPDDEDIDFNDVEQWLQLLERFRRVMIYEFDQQRLLWIPNFLKHQFIIHPSHSNLPPHPRDPQPWCRCPKPECVIELRRHKGQKLTFVENNGDNGDVPMRTIGGRHEDSSPPQIGLSDDYYTNRKGYIRPLDGKSSNNYIHLGENTQQSETPQQGSADESESEGRVAQSDLDKIARRILGVLTIPFNSYILEILTRSIEVKARTKKISIEAASQAIWMRAAWISQHSPPENWSEWLFDARYEYVPAGDSRLQDRHLEARPTCGGSECEDGWETFRKGESGATASRRCPACQKLWAE